MMTTKVSLLDESLHNTLNDFETLKRLDDLYAFYHKQWWCRRQMFYRFKRLNAFFNGMALVTMVLSFVVGSVWKKKSFAMIGLTAFATLIKGWGDFKKYSFKMDMCRFAYTTYEKTMIELRNHTRMGIDERNMNSFLTKMQTLDDTITDFAPPTDERYINQYERKFRHTKIQ